MNPWVNSEGKLQTCPCCGKKKFFHQPVLWEGLIAEWGLSIEEVEYIERQQGLRCRKCKSNLRSMVLAYAVMLVHGYSSGYFTDFVQSQKGQLYSLLEINQAGDLNQFLKKMNGHVLKEYPHINMMKMQFSDDTFDLVVHADTLEHIENPHQALEECLRILKPGGVCIFTVPIVFRRLTRSRHDMKPSYHGYGDLIGQPDYLVHTEFGTDIWEYIIRAGFSECRIVSLEYPAAQAILGIKHSEQHIEIAKHKLWGIFNNKDSHKKRAS